jgi:hypothetical protein
MTEINLQVPKYAVSFKGLNSFQGNDCLKSGTKIKFDLIPIQKGARGSIAG